MSRAVSTSVQSRRVIAIRTPQQPPVATALGFSLIQNWRRPRNGQQKNIGAREHGQTRQPHESLYAMMLPMQECTLTLPIVDMGMVVG